MTPVVALIDRPAGRPPADQVYGVAPPLADMLCDKDAPVGLVRVPGLLRTAAGPVTHVNAVAPVRLPLSVTVAATVAVPAVVGVPLMTPVEVLIDSPAGSPVAAHVYGAMPPVAARVTDVAATPVAEALFPGLVAVAGVATIHEYDALPAIFFASAAESLTAAVPTVVGVPLMAPVEALIDNPAGRPVADQV